MQIYMLMKRRQFLKHSSVLAGSMYLMQSRSLLGFAENADKPELAITMDDPNHFNTPLFEPLERNRKILEHLDKHNLKAALFVCGEKVDSPQGSTILQSWDQAGHLICNHSYSHYYYHSNKMDIPTYLEDITRCDKIISQYDNYTRLFRFPYLKEGNTIEKRDRVRKYLKEP